MGKVILLVDYENVQDINPALISEKDIEIKIFVGQSQNKLPFELVQATQQLGNAIEWIKIEGSGADSLDFHIAFYLGQLSQGDSHLSFTVLSKDKGFDPLIRYLCKRKIPCRRIDSLTQFSKQKENDPSKPEDPMKKVLSYLSKISKDKRPQSRNALFQYMNALLQRKLSEQELNLLIDKLIAQKKIAEVDQRITYHF